MYLGLDPTCIREWLARGYVKPSLSMQPPVFASMHNTMLVNRAHWPMSESTPWEETSIPVGRGQFSTQ